MLFGHCTDQGYGIIAPQTSAGWRDQQSCYGIKILCSSEAFFGVLFSGFCAAVLFGKISRFQSFAQVTFSDPVLVKYGTGVMTNDDDGDKSDEDDDNDSGPMSIAVQAMRKQVTRRKKLKKRLPCPVLEFQVVNNLHSLRGGEIMGEDKIGTSMQSLVISYVLLFAAIHVLQR